MGADQARTGKLYVHANVDSNIHYLIFLMGEPQSDPEFK